MSDSFIFPDDPDGFGPEFSDGDAPGGPTPAPDGPAFEDAPFESPDLGAPAFGSFEEPAFEAPGFGDAGAFEAPGFGEAGPFDPAPADAEAPTFGGASASEFASGEADGLSEDGVFFGGGAFDAPEAVLDGFDPPPGGDGATDVAFSETFSDGNADDEGGDEAPSPKAKKTASKRGRAKDALVLGVHVTPKQVYGVLVRPSGDGSYEPLRQFVRNRAESQFGQTALSPDDVQLEEATLEIGGDDPTIQFGGAGEIDFSAEFAGMGVVTDAALDTTATAGAIEDAAQPIIFELRDILEECAKAGFARPMLAFAVDAPDVAYAEITVPPEKKTKAKKPKKAKKTDTESADGLKESAAAPVKHERLMELVPDLGTSYDKERTRFMPMSPRDGLRRYLAVAPTSSEPVAESITMLREQSAHRKTVVKTLEAEVPLLVGLVRLTSSPESHENTAVVRVGAEDTIVLLLTGGELHHYEPMQSVTAFDGPDTICSRVLLQQDVQGVGTVHNVVVVSEEREKELVQGFAAFYPEARVETLREGLARHGLVGPYGPLAPALVEAAGAAVAGHRAKDKHSPFPEVNLLPASLLKKRRKVEFSFGWHTLVVAMLLFLSVLYFSYLYVSQEGAIAQAEQTLAEFPPEAQLSVPVLEARIDSLRRRQVALSATLTALDSLLVGTDRWTQTLIRTTRAAAQTGGVWIEEWSPSGNKVELAGYATTRQNVVGLAQRLNGTIEEVTFQEVREYPVYQYQISFDQPQELPQITRVLREQVGDAPTVTPEGPLADVDASAL
ncbi:hypothetical protein [Rubrivirga sp. IMCC45206]|uniref:hypothetical protein n=1 Tax=Rubrivirga sp. IMCC45206 TaxID=3391614 RepID=UPI00398FC960